MNRIKPNPIPPIRPVWEYQASGDLLNSYKAYKRALGIPWVGVVTLAYAAYPTFFKTWWRALEPVVARQAYEGLSLDLRDHVENQINQLNPKLSVNQLLNKGYSKSEINEIRHVIETITHGNFMQIVAVFSARYLLEGGELHSQHDMVEGHAKREEMADQSPLVLIEPHHALSDTNAIYDDIKSTIGLPFVNTDYRALARWPSYFEMAWHDLKPHISTPEYEALVHAMHDQIIGVVRQLPNPTGLTSGDLISAAKQDASLDDVLNMTQLFTWLLPGLVTNVAFFRAQLLEDPQTRP